MFTLEILSLPRGKRVPWAEILRGTEGAGRRTDTDARVFIQDCPCAATTIAMLLQERIERALNQRPMIVLAE